MFGSAGHAIVLGVALLSGAPALAEVRTLISAPLDAASATEDAEVELLFTNAGERGKPIAAPERVNAELRVQDRTVPVILERHSAETTPVAISAGSFSRISNRLKVPTELAAETLLMLSIPALGLNSAALIVPHVPVANAQASPTVAPARTLTDRARPRDEHQRARHDIQERRRSRHFAVPRLCRSGGSQLIFAAERYDHIRSGQRRFSSAIDCAALW